jgi:hypothetical protein
MQDEFYGKKLGGNGGEIEVDESFIGGKTRNMHVSERKRRITGTGTKDKIAVMGILERHFRLQRSLPAIRNYDGTHLPAAEACRSWRGSVLRRTQIL